MKQSEYHKITQRVILLKERRKNVLQIEYKNEKVKNQCTSVKAAKKLFGGEQTL
jgi:hypothetical protein